MTKKHQSGFSLIELMVVIAIIAILAVIGMAGYSNSIKKARDTKRKSTIQALAQNLTLYRMDYSRYPSLEEYFMTVDPSDSGSNSDSKKTHAFAGNNFANTADLIDPDNKTCYVYCCANTRAITTSDAEGLYKCSQSNCGDLSTSDPQLILADDNLSGNCVKYAVCAKLENGGGNVASSNSENGFASLIPLKSDFLTLHEDQQKDWYCAVSP